MFEFSPSNMTVNNQLIQFQNILLFEIVTLKKGG